MHLVQNIFLPNAAMIAAEAIGAFAANEVEVDTSFTRSSLEQRAALLAAEADVAVTALDNLFAWNQAGAGSTSDNTDVIWLSDLRRIGFLRL